ncbi:MAG: Cell wall-associated glycosyl hydrolase [Thermoleophilia bacterium]|nr:Cell wall-associated glycosyl hydrolase [Thermoleophilia bacterium]
MLRSMTRVRVLVATSVACVGLLLAVPGAGMGAAVPGPVLERLEADVTRATRAAAAGRPALVKVARAQRLATADAERVAARLAVIEGIVETFPTSAGAPTAAAFSEHAATVRAAALTATGELDEVTEGAAELQGDVLDAQRRLAAIRRAVGSAGSPASPIGSWRFGSGGPTVSAESIDRFLASKGSPMAGHGRGFLKAGLEHDLDPRLIVAIAGAESYFGAETCAPFNGWGWGCPTSPFRFTSWDEGAMTVAAGLRSGYLDDGLTTIGKIHLRYAPPAATNDPTGLNYGWADNVARFLVEQGGDPEAVSGVLPPSR